MEVAAALWRKHRLGEISVDDAALLIAEFEAHYFGTAGDPGRFVVVAVTATTLDDAARLAGVHGLRAYDAIQLAGALATRTAGVPMLRFLAFDSALRTAAAEGLALE